MDISYIKSNIKANWADSPVADVCLRIIEGLERLPQQELNFLTYKSFANLIGTNIDSDELLAAINVLTASKYAILESHGLFVDNESNEYELSDAEFSEALSTNTVVHPITGEIIYGARDMIIPFFSSRSEFLLGTN